MNVRYLMIGLLGAALAWTTPQEARAQGVADLEIRYIDGSVLRCHDPRECDQAMRHFVFGLRDGTLLAKHGKNVLKITRRNGEAIVTLPRDKPRQQSIKRLQQAFFGRKAKAQDGLNLQLCKINLEDLAQVLVLYKKRNRHLPPELDTLVDRGYITEVPHCPTCNPESDDGAYYYRHEAKGQFTLYCQADHSKVGVKRSYPRYSTKAHSVVIK
jgi:hypothetical protein